jgi:hypothetical protein
MSIRNTPKDTYLMRPYGAPRARPAAQDDQVPYLLPFDAWSPLEVALTLGEWFRAACPDHRPEFVRAEADDRGRVVGLFKCAACRTEEWRYRPD